MRYPFKTAFRAACCAAILASAFAAPAHAQRGPAADFPPGHFTDGGRYTMEDMKGKVVVLYFYEKD